MLGSHRFVCYRGAIALNNAGVSLLERQAYRQAFTTLTDAVNVMKLAFAPDRQAIEISLLDEVAEKVDLAMLRLASPQIGDARVGVKVVSHDGTLDHLDFYSILMACTKSNLIFPIRIESVSTGTSDGGDPNLAAVGLYNLGLSQLCISKLDCGQIPKDEIAQGSVKMFKMVLYLTTENGRLSTLDDDDIAAMHEACLVMVFTTIKMVAEELTLQGNMDEAVEYFQKLRRLGQAIIEREMPLITAAAAAA